VSTSCVLRCVVRFALFLPSWCFACAVVHGCLLRVAAGSCLAFGMSDYASNLFYKSNLLHYEPPDNREPREPRQTLKSSTTWQPREPDTLKSSTTLTTRDRDNPLLALHIPVQTTTNLTLKLSIVSPVYNAEKLLPKTYQKDRVRCKFHYQWLWIIRSKMLARIESWKVYRTICRLTTIKGTKAFPQFWEHYAITALGSGQGWLGGVMGLWSQE